MKPDFVINLLTAMCVIVVMVLLGHSLSENFGDMAYILTWAEGWMPR